MTTPFNGKPAGSLRLEDLPDEDDFCRQCGKALPVDNMYGWRKFCSNRCRNAWHYAQRPQDYRRWLGERKCQTCGGTFMARTDKQKFCGLPCYWKAKKGKPPPWLKERIRCEASRT